NQQNVQVVAGQIGQPPVPAGQQFQLTINTLGRLTDPEQFADIIVKAGQGSTSLTSTSSAGGSASSQNAAASPVGAAMPSNTQSGATGQSATNSTTPAPQTTSIVRLRQVVTQTSEGTPRVELGAQQYDQSCTLDGRPSVALSIYQLPG